MLYTNGSIQFSVEADGGYDSNGNPTKSSLTWGNEMRCNIRTTNRSNQNNADGGKYQKGLYTVLLATHEVSENISKVRLKKDVVGHLGEFRILEIIYQKAVNNYEIRLEQWQA